VDDPLTVYKKVSTITIDVGFDYRDEYTETVTGYNVPVNSETQVQMEHKLETQKCEAIRFRITESSASSPGTRLVALSLLVGLKPGMFRLESRKRV